MTSCPIVGPTGLHKKKRRRRLGTGSPQGFIHLECFYNRAATIPFVCILLESLSCWKSPFLKGIEFAFLKKVASAAELLTFQTLGHWGRRGAQQRLSPGQLVSGLLLLACQAALQIFPLPQDQPPLTVVCTPPLLLERLRFGERWLLRVLSVPSETLGPSLASGLMRLWVQKLVFGQRGKVGSLRGAFYPGARIQGGSLRAFVQGSLAM